MGAAVRQRGLGLQPPCAGAELGSLTGLLQRITPAVIEVTGGDARPGADDAALVQRVVEANVRTGVTELRRHSPVLRAREAAGELAIVGAVYELTTGRIDWMQPD